MKSKLLADFQICISVLLKKESFLIKRDQPILKLMNHDIGDVR